MLNIKRDIKRLVSVIITGYSLSLLIIAPPLGYAQTSLAHNDHQERSISSTHYRRKGRVEFRNWVERRKVNAQSIDREALTVRLLHYQKLSEAKGKEFSQPLPSLGRCEKSGIKINKDLIAPIDENEALSDFQVDLLFYDSSQGGDRAAAELWFGTTVPYDPANPSTKSRLGYLLGLECLPSRMVLTERGLEIRTGDAAWRIKSTDRDQRGKVFKRTIKQVQNDLNE